MRIAATSPVPAPPRSAARPGRDRRQEFEYRRGGTLAHLAADDVHAARVLGRTAEAAGIAPSGALVEQVMTTDPYASASRVFWIVDNGSSHNGARTIQPMRVALPTACLVHPPVHASWLNQVEIDFSILQRKAIRPADFTDLEDLAERLLTFQNRCNSTAEPFDWTPPAHPSIECLNGSPSTNLGPHDPRRVNGANHWLEAAEYAVRGPTAGPAPDSTLSTRPTSAIGSSTAYTAPLCRSWYQRIRSTLFLDP